ncbi:helix-turn-helix domain-containing protein, partial [Microcoleus sp. C2C3]|uniref:helix-turn-helix domain-containing protein n=1 Tax=unclassified Microcoleus TaxID=2642155 RepID=UPI002FD092E8
LAFRSSDYITIFLGSLRNYFLPESLRYKTMYNWLNRWEDEGMLGLYNKPGRGRKKTFDAAQSDQIRDWVKLQPKQLKQVVQKIKKEWSVNISTETIKRIIKKKG